jgi:hypothetical protein
MDQRKLFSQYFKFSIISTFFHKYISFTDFNIDKKTTTYRSKYIKNNSIHIFSNNTTVGFDKNKPIFKFSKPDIVDILEVKYVDNTISYIKTENILYKNIGNTKTRKLLLKKLKV